MPSDDSRRVTFTFGPTKDVRYLTDFPEVGDRVTHGSELWFVSQLEKDSAGVVVVCVPSSVMKPGAELGRALR